MALFGLLKDSKNPGGMSGNEKAALLFAGLSDFGAMRGGQEATALDSLTKLMAGKREKAKKAEELSKLMGALLGSETVSAPEPIAAPQSAGDYAPSLAPISATSVRQLPQKTRSGPMAYNDPRVPQIAMQAKLNGFDPTVAIDWLKNTGEQRYEQGVRYSPHGANNPAYIPKQIEGAMPEFGPDGSLKMKPIEGAQQIAANTAGAVAGAQEGAKSAYDIIEMPMRDGTTRRMTRFQASQMLSGQGGALPPGFGQTPTPGEVEADKTGSRLQAEATTGAQIDLPNVEAKAKGALSVIDSLLQHPAIEARTGLPGKLYAIPGTPGVDFDRKHKQIMGKAFLEAFETLKGGGAITEREGQAAQAAITRLDRDLGDEDYKAALLELRGIISTGVSRAQQKAGGGAQRPAPAQGRGGASGGRWTPEQARAELARRRAAAGQ